MLAVVAVWLEILMTFWALAPKVAPVRLICAVGLVPARVRVPKASVWVPGEVLALVWVTVSRPLANEMLPRVSA